MLVERFVRAVVDDGLDVDSAARHHLHRARGRRASRARSGRSLLERGRPDLALELDGAWISTIHGFCRRLLGAYPLAAGIDPRFRVLDESQARVLQAEAFTAALEAFCAADEPDRWQLLATYGADGLRRDARRGLRDAPLGGSRARSSSRVPAPASTSAWTASARRPTGSSPTPRRPSCSATRPRRALDLLGTTTLPERLLALGELKVRGPRAASFAEARDAAVAAALEELAARDRELLQELLTTFAAAYADAKDRESALDFEDLQLRARDLLGNDPEIRERERQRFRSIMVDEFQDTNRLQTELLDLLAPIEGGDLFVVGDEFQSIYGFRHADVAVFRERREAASTVLPLTRNYRSRPEVLAAVNELFAAEFGDEFQRARAGGGIRPAGASERRRAARHGQGRGRRDGRPLAPLRGPSRRPSRPRARRCRRRDAGGDRPPLRSRHRRRVVRGGAACRRPADVPCRRPQLLRPAAGRRPARLPAAAPQPLRRRGAAHRARVAVRRRLERRARPHPRGGAAPADLQRHRARHPGRSLGGRPPPRAGLPPAVRPPARELAATRRSSSSASACSSSTTTTSPFSRATTGSAATRTSASSPAWRARTRSCAAPTSRASSASSAGRRPSAPRSRMPSSEEEGADAVRLLTIHAAKGLEFKVVVVADAGRERVRRIGHPRLSDGRFGFKVAHPATGTRVGTESYRRRQGDREQAERGGAAAPLLRGDDACDGAADRLRLGRDGGATRDERTPIGWVLERLGLEEEARRPSTDGPVEVERGAATVVAAHRPRPAAPAPPPAVVGGAVVSATEAGQLALFEGAARRCRRPAPRLRELTVVPDPPLHRVARLSYSALSLFERCSLPLLRRARRRHAPDRLGARSGRRRRAACTRPRSGTPSTGCSSSSTSRAPAPPRGLEALVRSWYPTVTDPGARTRDDARRRVLRIVARPRGSPGWRASAPSGRSPSSSTTCSQRPPRRPLAVGRRARSCSTTRRTHSTAAIPAEIVEAEYLAQRIVYALACLRAGAERGRGRLPLPRGSRSGRLERRSRRRRSRCSSGSSGSRSRASARASSGRRRARSPARGALRSTSSAPGHGSAGP